MQRTLAASDPNWQRLLHDEQWQTLADEWSSGQHSRDDGSRLLERMLDLLAAHGLLGKQPATNRDQEIDSRQVLHPDDVRILQALARAKTTVLQYHLEKDPDVNLSRRTISERLSRLREIGLTHRPNGERGGEAITAAGRRWLSTTSDAGTH